MEEEVVGNKVSVSVTEIDKNEDHALHEPHKIFFPDVGIKKTPFEEMSHYQSGAQADADPLLLPMKMESVIEELNVYSVIKEEIFIEDDLHDEVIAEVCATDTSQADDSYITRGSKEYLDSHETNSDVFQICRCDICNIRYVNFSLLSKHKWSKHGIASSLNMFQCNVCNRQFDQLHNLFDHKLTHVSQTKRIHLSDSNLKSLKVPCKCDICNEYFANFSALSQHKLLQHRVFKPFPVVNDNDRMTDKKNVIKKKYYCDLCKKFLKYKGSFVKHISRHENKII